MVGLVITLAVIFSSFSHSSPSLKINGSTTVNPIVVEAAEIFRTKSWRIIVDTQGGSSGGISSLAEGYSDIAMVSRPLNALDKEKFPNVSFYETAIGLDGVSIAVSRPVYDGGVRAVSREDLKKIYESKIKSWKELGGPGTPIVFYNKEVGRGTWEVFIQFLYPNSEKIPDVEHPEVGGNEEGRLKVSSHSSAVTQISASWIDGQEKIRSLGLKLDNGKIIPPTYENIKNGIYPIKRPLVLVTKGTPKGFVKEFVSYLVSPEGQKLVAKQGYIPIKNS